ncbi:MAG: hypothetical protein M1830_001039 [Pleopsidium flavum]|nr:MAG: hypothetical protein M1830_001039 [Pleopsidium flavum]
MSSPEPLHPPITGGCLCGQVRYTIHFPAGSKWPPDPHTCQCTQCRKGLGALMGHYITISATQITWTDTNSTFKRFNSSPNAYRGFCANCGSTLTWQNEKEIPGEIELLTGTVDEKWLVGTKDGEGVGRELCEPRGGNFWFANAIKGVTDEVRGGKKFVEGSVLGTTMD